MTSAKKTAKKRKLLPHEGPRPGAPKGPRPITRALELVEAAPFLIEEDEFRMPANDWRELRKLLREMDASTGTPDTEHGRKR